MTLHERLLFNRSEKKSDQKKITYIPIDKIRPNPYQPEEILTRLLLRNYVIPLRNTA